MPIKAGPFKTALEASKAGIIRQEYTVYKLKHNIMVKETIIRKHKNGSDDYHDTTHIETLI